MTRNVTDSFRWFSFRQDLHGSIITTAGVVIAVLMATICAAVLYQSRVDAMDRAAEASRNVALLAERDIERTFELYALSLQAAVEGMNDPEVLAASPQLRNMALFDRAATATHLGSMLVLDAEGSILIDAASSVPRKANFADREYFQVHREHPDVGLYVGRPYASRLRDGSLSIPLSRRISRADGSFAGIVLIAVQLDYFHNLFSALSLGPHGSIALIRRDGTMIMRQPYDEKVIGSDIHNASTFKQFLLAAEGSFSGTSTIDGVQRRYYFKNLSNLPLIIMVAEAHSDIYAAWRHRALTIAVVLGILVVAFIALSIALGTQMKRRRLAESELAILARTDGLTGLNNRRTLDEILDQEWRRARRNGSMLSLLFMDIDRFKSYNDTYGHQAGDEALVAVAKCIGNNIRRPGDSAARYGGEEFVVVLPDTTQDGAINIAESIRMKVSDLSIKNRGSEYDHITISVGVVTWMPEQKTDIAALIYAADQALYSAKTTGRNRVAVSTAHFASYALDKQAST